MTQHLFGASQRDVNPQVGMQTGVIPCLWVLH